MVSAVSFRSFRFDVSPFSTCPFILVASYSSLVASDVTLLAKVHNFSR